MNVGEIYQMRDSTMQVMILDLNAKSRFLDGPCVAVRIMGTDGSQDYVTLKSEVEKSLGERLF